MSLVVNHNLMAANSSRYLNTHYKALSDSTRKLSSGLRVETAADDAAGLAIRELMRADIAALKQGVRNANDGISLIQTADGALGVIDEKLVRMKELAEQAATGTYDSTQRMLINNEFQLMGHEINRIANATNFNGIKLLDGSRSGGHDGSGLNSTGAVKIHFGTGNDSAEDYYYLSFGNATLRALDLVEGGKAGIIFSLGDMPGATDTGYKATSVGSGLISMSYIPKGAKGVEIIIDGLPGAEDDIQLFTRDGYHLAGTKIEDGADNDYTWRANGITGTADAAKIMTAENGFLSGDYKLPGDGVMSGTFNDGGATKDTWSLGGGSTVAFQRTAGSGEMHITYSGDYDRLQDTPNKGSIPGRDNPDTTRERIYIDEVTEDLLVIISGKGIFNIDTTWGDMPKVTATLPEGSDANLSVLSIETQARAQRALPRVDQAMINTNSIRAHLGSMQNRLENTVTNLEIQAENLQASESRISDADAAGEMTEFARSQILTRTATAMLAQANSLPGLLAGLLNG